MPDGSAPLALTPSGPPPPPPLNSVPHTPPPLNSVPPPPPPLNTVPPPPNSVPPPSVSAPTDSLPTESANSSSILAAAGLFDPRNTLVTKRNYIFSRTSLQYFYRYNFFLNVSF